MRGGGVQAAAQLRLRGQEGLLLRGTQGGGDGGRGVAAVRGAKLPAATALRLRGTYLRTRRSWLDVCWTPPKPSLSHGLLCERHSLGA